MDEALELDGQDDVDEDDGQPQRLEEAREGVRHLLGLAALDERDALREIELLLELLDDAEGLAGRGAGHEVGEHVHDALAILAPDGRDAGSDLLGDHGRDRDQATVAGHGEGLDRRQALAGVGSDLQADVQFVVALDHGAHDLAGGGDPEGVGQGRRRDALGRRAGAVDLELDFRTVQGERGVDVGKEVRAAA
ncbi:hypothetical protein D3C87_1334200 [compost metagenome]